VFDVSPLRERRTQRYAEGTTTPIETSQAEIHRLLRRYGATEFSTGWSTSGAGISFVFKGRRCSFTVPAAAAKDVPRGIRNGAAWLQTEERRRWRCMVLALKAKLEWVADGISSFEAEFLAHIVTPDGRTVIQCLESSDAARARLLGPVSR
jgi:hypothetical protein